MGENPSFLYLYTSSVFTWKKSQDSGKWWNLFSIQKCWGHFTQCFNLIIRGTVMSFAKQNPRRLFFYYVISPDTLEGCFKTEILGFCHSVEQTSFKPWCNLWILNYIGSWDRADLPKPKVDKYTQLSQVLDVSAIGVLFRSLEKKRLKIHINFLHVVMSFQYVRAIFLHGHSLCCLLRML